MTSNVAVEKGRSKGEGLEGEGPGGEERPKKVEEQKTPSSTAAQAIAKAANKRAHWTIGLEFVTRNGIVRAFAVQLTGDVLQRPRKGGLFERRILR
jgi:hypothetical protein